MKYVNIAGAILAGGKNTRIGREKAFIEINTTPLIQKTIQLFRLFFDEIIIITNCPQYYAPYAKDAVIVSDIIKDIGPLGGIHAGLSYSSKEDIFFVACDMPFLQVELIGIELEYFNRIQCDALIPRLDYCIEPLHGVYKKTIKNRIPLFIKNRNDYSITSFLRIIDTRYWDIGDNFFNRRIFKNINTPQDLMQLSYIT